MDDDGSVSGSPVAKVENGGSDLEVDNGGSVSGSSVAEVDDR